MSLSRGRRNGFTLIEVMISVALVLMLTYGVAQVFQMSSATIGAQTAIGGIVRDHRAAVNTLTEDFRNCVNDSPLFLIDSQVAWDGTPEQINGATTNNGVTIRRGFRAGFRTPLDETQSLDPNKDPTKFEINGQTFTADFNTYTDRTPRLDRLGFFARGMYRRQTAGNTQVFSPTTSTEAYIWYGHTSSPGQATAPIRGSKYPAPGGPAGASIMMTLPQNQYGQDRILGRMAILLADPTSVIAGDSFMKFGSPPSTLAPLDYDTQVWNSLPTGTDPINNGSFQTIPPAGSFSSLTDMAAVTIDQWRYNANIAYSQVPAAVPPLGPHNWYYPMDDDLATLADNSNNSPVGNAANDKIWRALCQPTLQRPINSQKLAQTTSCFIPNCTQFIVEYAGDFLAQNSTDPTLPAGWVTDAGKKKDPTTGVLSDGQTDGEIDYILDDRGFPNDKSKWVKKIRWYGLPRDTNGDGKIDITDVLPLADVMDFYAKTNPQSAKLKAAGATFIAPWENLDTLPKDGLMAMANHDYANFKVSNGYSARNFKYICAWHNDAPPMIRISLKFNDPAGRLQDGQWYEYILTR